MSLNSRNTQEKEEISYISKSGKQIKGHIVGDSEVSGEVIFQNQEGRKYSIKKEKLEKTAQNETKPYYINKQGKIIKGEILGDAEKEGEIIFRNEQGKQYSIKKELVKIHFKPEEKEIPIEKTSKITNFFQNKIVSLLVLGSLITNTTCNIIKKPSKNESTNNKELYQYKTNNMANNKINQKEHSNGNYKLFKKVALTTAFLTYFNNGGNSIGTIQTKIHDSLAETLSSQKIDPSKTFYSKMLFSNINSTIQLSTEEIENLKNLKKIHETQKSWNTIKELYTTQAEKYTIPLQKTLQIAGFYTGEINGKYDQETIKAVEDFQTSKGLYKDGAAGKNTIAELLETNKEYCQKTNSIQIQIPQEPENPVDSLLSMYTPKIKSLIKDFVDSLIASKKITSDQALDATHDTALLFQEIEEIIKNGYFDASNDPELGQLIQILKGNQTNQGEEGIFSKILDQNDFKLNLNDEEKILATSFDEMDEKEANYLFTEIFGEGPATQTILAENNINLIKNILTVAFTETKFQGFKHNQDPSKKVVQYNFGAFQLSCPKDIVEKYLKGLVKGLEYCEKNGSKTDLFEKEVKELMRYKDLKNTNNSNYGPILENHLDQRRAKHGFSKEQVDLIAWIGYVTHERQKQIYNNKHDLMKKMGEIVDANQLGHFVHEKIQGSAWNGSITSSYNTLSEKNIKEIINIKNSWEKDLRQEEVIAQKPGELGLIGDSHIAGLTYGNAQEITPKKRNPEKIVVIGRHAAISKQANSLLTNNLQKLKEKGIKSIGFSFGTNDIFNNISPENYKDNIEKAIKTALDFGIQPVLFSTWYKDGNTSLIKNYFAITQAYDNVLKNLAKKYNIPYKEIKIENGVDSDNVHFTPNTYKAISQQITKFTQEYSG